MNKLFKLLRIKSSFGYSFFYFNHKNNIAICNIYLVCLLQYAIILVVDIITMRIISEKKLREFWGIHPEAENSMREWIRVVRFADWESFSDIRKTFNHADIYRCCIIFDVGGNKYRIIAKVAYKIHIVFIRFVLTHKEYDEQKWQSDCDD